MVADPHGPPCYAREPVSQAPPRKRGLGVFATAGALVAAILASACCWLPLVAVVFGASVAGARAFLASYRPHFLVAATVLLAAGFYFLYIRKEDCGQDGACSVPNPKARRFTQAVFWLSVLFIAAFAFFPSYVGLLLGGSGESEETIHSVSDDQVQMNFSIDGMSCQACSTAIRAGLEQVSGVAAADVSFEKGRASVRLEPGAATTAEDLIAAIERLGYRATRTPTTGGER